MRLIPGNGAVPAGSSRHGPPVQQPAAHGAVIAAASVPNIRLSLPVTGCVRLLMQADAAKGPLFPQFPRFFK